MRILNTWRQYANQCVPSSWKMLSLQSLPLSSGQRARLKAAGYEKLDDLNVSKEELAAKLNIPNEEASEILEAIRPARGDAVLGRSALEVLRSEEALTPIITFSARVDDMLGGGVALGKITEICGAPGTGKTQFSMQLAVDASIPEAFGGVGGEAIFIDTEGSFVVERIADMAEAAVRHIANVADTDEKGDIAKTFKLESVLRSIHYYRCQDYVELVALTHLLPQIMADKPKVKVVVVDSIAAPFRQGFSDMGLRNRVLGGVAQRLIRLASVRGAAVVLTNQMTIKTRARESQSVRLTPALGESWGHACTVRVVLFWQQCQRFAMLYKSPSRKETVVPFQVTEEGIRDVYEQTDHHSQDEAVLRDYASLTSSQMAEIERPDGRSCDDEEDEVNGCKFGDKFSHLECPDEEAVGAGEATGAPWSHGDSGSLIKRPRSDI